MKTLAPLLLGGWLAFAGGTAPPATAPASFPVHGAVLDAEGQPVAGAAVSASSDTNGLVWFRLPPGEFPVNATDGWAMANGSASVTSGETNGLELELSLPRTVRGVVRRPDGTPAAGLGVQVIGIYAPGDNQTRTDAQGTFTLNWDSSRFSRPDSTPCLLIRDAAHGLAIATDIDEDTESLELKLAPGMTLAGRAECDGKPIANATATLVFWTGNSGMRLPGLGTGTNAPGHFEIPALPPGRRYGLYVFAPGYGQRFTEVPATDDDSRRVEVDVVELKPATLKLAGQVVDGDDKPVAGVYVNLHGEGQPNANTTTDSRGRFQLAACEGIVRLFASGENGFTDASADAGETNVVLQLSQGATVIRRSMTESALRGKPLPDLAQLGFAADASQAGQPVLLCLLDVEQRPSRRAVRLLAEHCDTLRAKGVSILALQTAALTLGDLKEWQAANPLPFPLAQLEAKSVHAKWAVAAGPLPWLILTDAKGRVTAEGFAIEDLDSELPAVTK